jgi:peptide/nickel transport system permease protein
MLSILQNYVTVYPATVVWPGLAITITVLGFNLFGDALREATDPRLRRSRGRLGLDTAAPAARPAGAAGGRAASGEGATDA